MHAVIHSDGSVIDERYRSDCLKRASNIVEITQNVDGTLNIENQYNFGIQTPGPGVYDMPLDKKPVMLECYGNVITRFSTGKGWDILLFQLDYTWELS